MTHETEWRIFIDRKESLLEKYIDSVMAGDIKNLTIKEEYIMLEELRMQREEYAKEVERLKGVDLDAITNERFELAKEKIAEEVKAEHEEQLAKAEMNVKHYDFVIETMEAKALVEAENVAENVDAVDCSEIVEG